MQGGWCPARTPCGTDFYEILFIFVLMGEVQCQNIWLMSHANYSWGRHQGEEQREHVPENSVLPRVPRQGGRVPEREATACTHGVARAFQAPGSC